MIEAVFVSYIMESAVPVRTWYDGGSIVYGSQLIYS